jgi:hypothetical protein
MGHIQDNRIWHPEAVIASEAKQSPLTKEGVASSLALLATTNAIALP